MFGIPGLARSGSRRAEVKSIRQILTGSRIFRSAAVGPEQRGRTYLWSAPEIAQFLIELEENSGERPSHADEECFYLGVLSLSHDTRPHNFRILDGLQRLTAIAMFLAFARDRLPSRGERARIDKLLYYSPWNGPRTPRLQLGKPEQDWFALFILDAGATRQLPAFADGESEHNLLTSAKFMRRVFRDYSTSQIRNLVRCLERRTAFVMSEAVANAIPDRFALPPPPKETPRDTPKEATIDFSDILAPLPASQGFAPLPPDPQPSLAPPPRPANRSPRRNTLWTSAQPFAIEAPTPKAANEDTSHYVAK